MKTIGIITARGGSVTLPKKNILSFSGKPLIAWTIEAALSAKSINRLILSTDSREIVDVAKSYGCDVPFIRPSNLSDSYATSADVVEHAIKNINESYDYFILLQPTSPLRTSADIDNAFNLMLEKKAESCVSVCLAKENPYYMKFIDEGNVISPIIMSNATRRQDMQKAYLLNGAIYINKVSNFMRDKKFVDDKTIAYMMPEERSIDIDTLEDFKEAQRIKAITSNTIEK